ncbi:helix-turn-helix domain-containing protein [Labrenzia sp. PHM005]|uniref:helix-turn-helix domain-containing protein n=1 Tax=Labrenzia sp. PHM005 TaxID=2590016 RepID=UPI0011401ECE|nr:helix-turn-helix transcriptional regulator [Labrenzia sp. PHM005]QDG76973.1 helix-turn-helix transcriptional regulator [Labrenzia sp. PHM005]
MNTQTNAFGSTLKTLRRERGLSQAVLADKLGSTQRHISFLETGRARPSPFMVKRIERELVLSVARGHVLYETAGFTSPYKSRAEDSPDVLDALDLIEKRLLANWPFPAFVLDKRWTILRSNLPGTLFLSEFFETQNKPPNLFQIFLSPIFRERVLNWQEAAPIFAARLYREAAVDPELAELLEKARLDGLLDGLEENDRTEVPVFVPVEFSGPDGTPLRLTSLLGQLASVQDAVIEGMTVELMVPMDTATEACLLKTGQQAENIQTAE